MPVPDGTILCTLHWTIGSSIEEALCTFHLEPVLAGVNAIANDLEDAVTGAWSDSNLDGYMRDTVTLDRLQAYRLDTSGHATEKGENVATLPGTNTQVQLPLEVACCVNTYAYDPGTVVLHRGRKRGRMYLPSPVVGAIDGTAGRFVDTFVDIAADFVTTLMDNMTSSGYIPTVLSRVAGANYPLTHVRVDNVPDVQRRRRRQETATYTKTQALA